MATSSKSKVNQQTVLGADLARILAELHQLACIPEADHWTRALALGRW